MNHLQDSCQKPVKKSSDRWSSVLQVPGVQTGLCVSNSYSIISLSRVELCDLWPFFSWTLRNETKVTIFTKQEWSSAPGLDPEASDNSYRKWVLDHRPDVKGHPEYYKEGNADLVLSDIFFSPSVQLLLHLCSGVNLCLFWYRPQCPVLIFPLSTIGINYSPHYLPTHRY